MKRELFENACDIDRDIYATQKDISLIKLRIKSAIEMMKQNRMIDIRLNGMQLFDDFSMSVKDTGIIKYLGSEYRKLYCQLRDLKKQFDNLK